MAASASPGEVFERFCSQEGTASGSLDSSVSRWKTSSASAHRARTRRASSAEGRGSWEAMSRDSRMERSCMVGGGALVRERWISSLPAL